MSTCEICGELTHGLNRLCTWCEEIELEIDELERERNEEEREVGE